MKLYLSCLFFISFSAHAQSLKRQTIASSVGNKSTDGVTVNQTIGQPYQTKTNQSEGIFYRPGFQQPVLFIEKISSTLAMTVFPNPTVYFVNISSEKILSDVKIQISDNAGKTVYEKAASEFKDYQIDCSQWAGGSYLISISNSTGYFSGKLILAR